MKKSKKEARKAIKELKKIKDISLITFRNKDYKITVNTEKIKIDNN